VRATGPTDRGSGPPGSHVACQRPSEGLGRQHRAGARGVVGGGTGGGVDDCRAYCCSVTPTFYQLAVSLSKLH
jgi:hypothetical protein